MRWLNERNAESLLRHALGSEHSDFYRKKYRAAGLREADATVENFFNLPALTRAELLETPILERLFVPWEDVRFVAFTSGTSSGSPLLNLYADIPRYQFDPAFGTALRRPLIVFPPINRNFAAFFDQICRQKQPRVSPMFGDFQNLANSAVLAEAVVCDSMYATPTIAMLFAQHAQARGICGNFKVIVLCSETLTAAVRQELHRLYPNAVLVNFYASNEIGQGALVPCPRLIEKDSNYFHVLSEDLTSVELAEDGELLLSYGLNRASPLIRYRTGDYFEEVPGGCDCGREGPVLQWSHRSNVDRLRLNGVEFNVEDVDRVFAGLRSIARPHYQIHFYPHGGASGVDIVVEIENDGSEPAAKNESRGSAIRQELLERWQVSSTATIAQALELGLFASLSVSFVPKLSFQGTKHKYFINHVR